MKRWSNKNPILILALLVLLTVGGLSAQWMYPSYPSDVTESKPPKIGTFKYGQLYITEINITAGKYASAAFTKIADTKISADIELESSADSTVTVEVVLYNETNVSYYYDTTETVSTNNEKITYTVSGIAQKDEIAAGSYVTVTLTFAYDGDQSATALLSELNLKFTVDKDSIGEVVAQGAVGAFEAILNTEQPYNTLINAMNDQGSTWNKGSAVTYIGNVSGAEDDDSSTITQLFTEEFMQADLDGDGVTEPITMMIKRENIDGNTHTGDDYSYTSWGTTTTVRGVEMTLYITSEEIGNNDIVVYAVVFTKYENSTEWTQIVPLTKGTAETNNYSSGNWGTANSFNTDTWKSDAGQTIEELVAAHVN